MGNTLFINHDSDILFCKQDATTLYSAYSLIVKQYGYPAGVRVSALLLFR